MGFALKAFPILAYRTLQWPVPPHVAKTVAYLHSDGGVKKALGELSLLGSTEMESVPS